MPYGLRKGLEDIAYELKGIRNILGSMWHSRYSNAETDIANPEMFADEYISTEECGRRLGVSDQTILAGLPEQIIGGSAQLLGVGALGDSRSAAQ